MKLTAVAVLLAAGTAGGWFYLQNAAQRAEREPAVLIERYCTDCHNADDFEGSLRLDDKHLDDIATDAHTWELVVRKLRTGMMPPADAPRPPRAILDSLALSLEHRLDAAPPVAAHRGTLRRLNRTEYANAIRDLLDLDVDAETLLPLDDSSEGFDNVATALGVSPSLVEAYVSAAMKISRRALGDWTTPESKASYRPAGQLTQNRHLEGLPLGTRGGIRVSHDFPLDAEYTISVQGGFRLPPGTRVVAALDGTPLAMDARHNITLPVTAGPHVLTAALVDSRRPAGVDDVYGEFSVPGSVRAIEVVGPLRPAGLGDTPSRRHILSCYPDSVALEQPCAEEIIRSLATRAFRRPQSAEAIAPLVQFYESARQEGSFEAGIQQALARILVDPRFVYRLERAPATLKPGEIFAIDDYDLASRLSFFLWSSIPDEPLLARAAADELHEPEVLAAEVERMLADPKAAALVTNFAAQWLFLRELDSVTPDAQNFDANLKSAMVEETRRLFTTVVREDLSVMRLLDADFTFLNNRLAEHYGIENVHGSYFRRVDLPDDSPRRGLLGHASILTVTSVTNRTSPVIRGSWILETLLGSPAPAPPPNVETTLAGDDGGVVLTTVRERLEAHRANPTCASCHAIMDPIGFALENFDLIGTWRDSDDGLPIDSRATLVDGTEIHGPVDLRQALSSRSRAFVTAMTEKLFTYALGRAVEHSDMPAIRRIVTDARRNDARFSTLIMGVVNSEAFRTHVKGAGD